MCKYNISQNKNYNSKSKIVKYHLYIFRNIIIIVNFIGQ
jgi:hypothetical protein